jgi:hypothetical protein
MAATYTYSPKDVFVSVGGVLIDTFDKISVSFNEDRVSHSSCATGHTTRVMQASRLGKITLVLPQTTPRNRDLLDIYEDILSNYASGVFASITIKDKLGFSVHRMTEASILRAADSDYEKKDTQRTWVFEGDLVDNSPRGNGSIAP